MNRNVFYVVLLFLFFSPNAWATGMISKGDVLTLERCLQIALKNHPAISAAKSGILQAESRIGQARSGYYPQVNLQSGYSRVGPAPTALRSDPYNYYSNALHLNQTLFDFGKTWTQVDISTLNRESARADFQDVLASVVFGVKEAYYAVVKARMSEKVAAETVIQFQQHYEIAKLFFETGKSSKIDVTSAEVNVSNARISLLSAQNGLRIARVTLNRAMGISQAPEYDIQEEFQMETEGISFQDALLLAYENRPELISTARKNEALEKGVLLNKKGYLPVLAGSASYGYAGDDTALDRAWNVGLTLTFPLFSGLSTKYAVEEAQAGLDIARANEDALRQIIHLEVESAYLNRKEAFERIEAGRIMVRQAEETLELAQGRYRTGVGSSIEITDAMIKLNNAKMTYITAMSDFSVAQAFLEKAIGAKQ